MLPAVLSLYVTNYCQLKCSHCFWVRNGLLNTDALGFDDIITVLDDAKQNKVYLVPVSGGDPLLHKDIFKIIAGIKSRGMLPLLGITGLGVDARLAQEIKSSGVPCVQVSLDGADEFSNAQFRGEGAFDEIVKSIRNLSSAGVNTNIAICVTPSNVALLGDILDLARRLNAFKVKVSFWESHGNTYHAGDYLLSDEEKKVVAQFCELYQKKYDRVGWITSPSHFFINANPNKSASKWPPLVVHPNGNFTVYSESGPIIGNMRLGKPSYFYKIFLNENYRK